MHEIYFFKVLAERASHASKILYYLYPPPPVCVQPSTKKFQLVNVTE